LQHSLLSPRWRRRFYSWLGSPLNAMSILSQFYFLMGVDVGHLFMRRVWFSFPIGTPLILFFTYCSAQTSFEVRNWEMKFKALKDRKD